MSRLEDLQPNASLRGVLPDALVTVVSVQWFGSEALELTYKDPAGKLGSELLYRHDEPRIEILYSLNKPDDFILALVEFMDEGTHRTHYLRQPFRREPVGVTSVNYDFAELLARAEGPR